jgi:hypothetical protein
MRDTAVSYLKSDIDALLDMKSWRDKYHIDMSAIGHFVLRHVLLDRLANAVGMQIQPSIKDAPRLFLPEKAPQSFAKVRAPTHLGSSLS